MKAPSREVRFSVAQQAVVTLEKIRVQGAFVAINALLLLLVVYTSHRFPSKYVRVTGEYVATTLFVCVCFCRVYILAHMAKS